MPILLIFFAYVVLVVFFIVRVEWAARVSAKYLDDTHKFLQERISSGQINITNIRNSCTIYDALSSLGYMAICFWRWDVAYFVVNVEGYSEVYRRL